MGWIAFLNGQQQYQQKTLLPDIFTSTRRNFPEIKLWEYFYSEWGVISWFQAISRGPKIGQRFGPILGLFRHPNVGTLCAPRHRPYRHVPAAVPLPQRPLITSPPSHRSRVCTVNLLDMSQQASYVHAVSAPIG